MLWRLAKHFTASLHLVTEFYVSRFGWPKGAGLPMHKNTEIVGTAFWILGAHKYVSIKYLTFHWCHPHSWEFSPFPFKFKRERGHCVCYCFSASLINPFKACRAYQSDMRKYTGIRELCLQNPVDILSPTAIKWLGQNHSGSKYPHWSDHIPSHELSVITFFLPHLSFLYK